ncbi:MAG: phosphoribosylformylglycinamidine cyclo-ligase [Synergistaceae bacterium]|jgi:phosphoribosylformylglycinamidine cyclo-ligase|nr:phosphoribosylformylglycinamidine cyclo-ligase [Synergistaceae bacterium]
MDYKEAGVDIKRGDAWVETIKRLVSGRPELPKTGIGGFSGLIGIGGGRSIAACCDGVGTKVELARETGVYRGLGQDLVAMSVNDLVTCGAEPLFFLDYIACGALDETMMEAVMEGILDACCESRCALLGGETAEMPGVYPPNGFDLAGFAAGLVSDDSIIDGSRTDPGDVRIGLPSSGAHSTGYSLLRKILAESHADLREKPSWGGGLSTGEILMKPTRLYARQAAEASRTGLVKGMAHITGGGPEHNINRAIPKGLRCELDYDSWRRPGLFEFLADSGVEEAEMRRVFNLGIGYVFIVPAQDSKSVMSALEGCGESPWIAGRVVKA